LKLSPGARDALGKSIQTRKGSMEVDSAVKLIGEMQGKAGWSFKAESCCDRFEGSVRVFVTYPVRDTSRDHPQADINDRDEYTLTTEWVIQVAPMTDLDLYRAILDMTMDTENHEWREALRTPTGWAPFHPHRIDGMRRYGFINDDVAFGRGRMPRHFE